MAYTPQRHCVEVDGAESHYCDLSGRGLSAEQVERTLRVFATVDTIDLSNNEIDQIPLSIPSEVRTLDISFNAIASMQGIERLKFVQELHLAFNRLDDASALEFCPRLVRVNLSGNRLMHTKGLETLELLESLDLSDNLIEFPEALRPLSLNENMTHLSIRGNPLSQKPGYHVPILDTIPSLIMLDNKKMRNTVRYKTKVVSATKSLSYSRIYDDKKQFVIHQQDRSRTQHLRGCASKLDASSFGPSPTHRAGHLKLQQGAQSIAPPVPFPTGMRLSSLDNRPALYLSLYDRLALSSRTSLKRPVTPVVKPILDLKQKKTNIAALTQLRGKAQIVASRLHKPRTCEGILVTSYTDICQQPQEQDSKTLLSNHDVYSSKVGILAPTLGNGKQEKARIENSIEHKNQSQAVLEAQKVITAGAYTHSRKYNSRGQSVR